MPKKVVLEFDDFSILNNRFDLLFKLREHYPNLKVTMFMIPFHAEHEVGPSNIFLQDALDTLKLNLDWIQIIPHGITHTDREFEKADKTSMLLSIKAITDLWELQGIPFVKGFKAPQWLWNQDVVDVLDKKGWFGAVDRNQPDMIKTKKYYMYNFNIDEPFSYSDMELLKLHGHITSTEKNDFDKCFLNLMKLPADAEFHFVTDYLEDKK